MSALLKAGDGQAQSAVRPLGSAASDDLAGLVLPALPGAAARVEPSAAERKRIELEAELADLHRRLADARNDADAREDAAFARGRREGEDLATGETEKRLELLRSGLEALQQAHGERLAEYELLALQLARTALARLFGDESLRSELVAATVAHHLTATKRALVLGLRVSRRDFRAGEELDALAARFPGLDVTQDDALAAGDCVIDLRLGTIELGLPGQWQRLCGFFDALAEREGEA